MILQSVPKNFWKKQNIYQLLENHEIRVILHSGLGNSIEKELTANMSTDGPFYGLIPDYQRMRQDCILHSYLFSLHAGYILSEAGVEDECGFKIGGRKISNLHYIDS